MWRLLAAFAIACASAHKGGDGGALLPRAHPNVLQPGAPPQVFSLTLLTDAANNDGAVSLDGSPGAYYYFKGGETRKWYIHQEGGGWCGSDADCLARSRTALGSSRNLKPTENIAGGYFDNTPAVNPLMWNWTKVFLPCVSAPGSGGAATSPRALFVSHPP